MEKKQKTVISLNQSIDTDLEQINVFRLAKVT